MDQKNLYSSHSISILNLSVRAVNCLKGVGIVNIEQLLEYKESDLLNIPNLDINTLFELERKLNNIGLSLESNCVHATNKNYYVKLSKKQFAKLLLTVDELLLPSRLSKALNEMDIKYVGDLVHIPENVLLKWRNIGRKSISELKKKIHDLDLNFNLGMNVDTWPPLDMNET